MVCILGCVYSMYRLGQGLGHNLVVKLISVAQTGIRYCDLASKQRSYIEVPQALQSLRVSSDQVL